MVSALDLLLVGGFLYGIYYFFVKSNKKYNLPPGPWNIPLISGMSTVGANPHLVFRQWAKKYGPLIRIKFGLQDALIIDDPKLMREAFAKTEFSGRMDFKTFSIFSNGKHGIVSGEGQEWAEQRRFVLRTLRDFGFGKHSMEGLIVEEIQDFLKWMKDNEGLPTEIKSRLVLATVSTLWSMMAGEKQDQNDDVLKDMIEKSSDVFNEAGQATGIWIMFPQFIDILPKFMLKGWYRLVESSKPFMQVMDDAVQVHLKNPGDPSEPRDLIDVYLQEVKKTTDPNSSFYGERGLDTLKIVMTDLYGAGSGTTSNLLSWGIIYLVKFPHVQKKLQKELDAVVGHNRLPSLADRPNLPYTEALILELYRFSAIAPLGLFHETLEDTTIGGYDIKKGTAVIPNLYSMSYNPTVYGDPENFRPERFLSADGCSVSKAEDLMPFGTGKRQCLGETMGRDNVFLFFTSIFHRFEICEDPKAPLSLEATPGFFREPEKFNVIFNERN